MAMINSSRSRNKPRAGPHGFQRTVTFALDEVPAAITLRVRETLDD
jgi:hypothetical protein